MKRNQILFIAGWALFVISFFAPVVRDGTTLAKGGIPGWEAMSLALGGRGGSWGIVSGLTNLLMLGTVIVLRREIRGIVFGFAVLVIVATLLNGYWFFAVDSRGDLLLGYYLWWTSFAVLSVGLFLLARSLMTSLAGDLVHRHRSHNSSPAEPI